MIDFDKSAHIQLSDHRRMQKLIKVMTESHTSPDESDMNSASCPHFTPYISPELIYKDPLSQAPMLKVVEAAPPQGTCLLDSVQTGKSVFPASYAVDMWALGVLLYRLCTNTDLFPTNKDGLLLEDEQQEQLWRLATWTEELKWQKMEKVTNQHARNLLWRLLHKDPSRRPTADEALVHPFVRSPTQTETQTQTQTPLPLPPLSPGGKVLPPGVGHIEGGGGGAQSIANLLRSKSTPTAIAFAPPNPIRYDVFLSCGCDVDAVHASVVVEMLRTKGLRVFWHRARFCNLAHSSTSVTRTEEEEYCDNLSKCHTFVPLLSCRVLDCFSYDVLHVGGKVSKPQTKPKSKGDSSSENSSFVPTSKEAPWDNFLFGLRYAIELKELGVLENLFPVVIGEKGETGVLYEGSGNLGSTPGSRYLSAFLTRNTELEAKLRFYLDKEHLGPPVRHNQHQIDLISMVLLTYKGFTLRGKIANGYQRVVEGILSGTHSKAATAAMAAVAGGGGGGGGSVGVRATIGALEERLKEQEILLETQEIQLERQTAALERKTIEVTQLLATQHEEFKEFNRMKEALTRAKLKILDLKLGGGKAKGARKGGDDDEDDDDEDEDEDEDDYEDEGDDDDEDEVVEEEVTKEEEVKHHSDDDTGNSRGDVDIDSAAVIAGWLNSLEKKPPPV